MKEIDFPIFKIKKDNDKKFDLSDPKERLKYFQFKAGKDIDDINKFLEKNTFVVYLLGKKSAGKGTYSKMVADVIGKEKVEHFSIGDMIRDIDKELKDDKKREELISFLEDNYRGWLEVDEVIARLEGRSTESLLPTPLILTLVKREIARRGRKALFIDGFPRNMDQISYSLFFRDLLGYRDDVDIFALIDVPESIIDERIKYRRVCPKCNTSRNLKLLPTSKVKYDEETGEFYLLCDNPDCEETRMIRKEGDEKGIEPIKERLKMDEKLIEHAFKLYGIPKILVRNAIPIDKADQYVADYEITPEYQYEVIDQNKVQVKEVPWVIRDDKGIKSYSLLAPPAVVSFLAQIADILRNS